MKPKKLSFLLTAMLLVYACTAFAYDTSMVTLEENALKFASRYDYREGDMEKSLELYPDIVYSSGIEYREDGTEYECPIRYNDDHAMYFDDYDLTQGELTIVINDTVSQYSGQCVLYKGTTLVPTGVFEEAGCDMSFDSELYVTTLTKNGTVLEILPQLKGMRKNQADGYYVPLAVCARFIDDTVYVPVRAVSNEFDFQIDWNGTTHTVTLQTD